MRKLLFGLLLLFMIGSASAASSFSGARSGTSTFVTYSQPDFNTYYSSEGRLSTYWPILDDPDTCEARQDLLIQVAPGGCQPAVVRSDILAEQNVPVFCRLDALRLNPLIDIKQIRNIRFTGKYPKEVVGVGFHPARAALRTGNNLLGSPLINDIGYVVIVLRKNANETSLPNLVNFTLQAKVDYYAGNALGIGRTEFLLKDVTDDEWKVESKRQSFFNGRYSVRLEQSDPDRAIVAIYSGDRRISTASVKEGSSSNDLYLPGSYCQLALKVYNDGFKTAEDTARLQVGEDVIDVYEGSRFANGKCSVRAIDVSGVDQGSVRITCPGARDVTLRVTGLGLNVGDEVYVSENGVAQDEVWVIRQVNYDTRDRSKVLGYNVEKGTERKNVDSNLVTPANNDKLSEKVHDNNTERYFKEAIDNYRAVADNYPLEKDKRGATESVNLVTFGEDALQRAINLALSLGKQRTAVELMNLYVERYPDSANTTIANMLANELRFDTSQAATAIEVDNDIKTIRLIEVREPAVKPTAILSIGSVPRVGPLQEGGNYSSIGMNLTIEDIQEDRVRVSVACPNSNGIDRRTVTLYLDSKNGDDREEVCGQTIRLNTLDAQQYNKIRIEPVTRGPTIETNLTVGVGIEKRAIKLTPDKTKERIDNLNKTIEKWDKVSNGLGNVVKGMKAACLATAGVLTAKNFVTGLSGEALARQKVMRGPDGWTEWCRSRVGADSEPSYDTIGECYSENSGKINSDVGTMSQLIAEENRKIKEADEASKNSDNVFGEYIDSNKANEEFITKNLDTYDSRTIDLGNGQPTVNVGQLTKHLDGKRQITYDEAKDMKLYLDLREKSPEGSVARDLADENLRRIGQNVYDRQKFSEARGNLPIRTYEDRRAISGTFSGRTLNEWDAIRDIEGTGAIPADTPSEIVSYKNELYLVTFNPEQLEGNKYEVAEAYKLDRTTNGLKVGEKQTEVIGSKFGAFTRVSRNSCSNKFNKAPAAQFYETEPYKGMPALVPFDLQEGWYVGTRQSLPGFGNVKAFQSSGRPASFWICNIGPDREADFYVSGFDDDICEQFNVETGQPLNQFSCLSEEETQQLVRRATNALTDAARQYEQGKKGFVNIEGQSIKIGEPALNIPGTQCQDFMSPDDCKLLFNVCDPVICPASRCNLGGAWPVADVIQSGIVGSTVLCLPNFNEGVLIPVCLSGIKAGIDGYISILKSSQQCLQENLNSGKHVGICDEITSVYMCEFFWRQAAPVANVLLPKAVELLYGQTQARGGGEYRTVQSAWDNAQGSVNFFTQSYAVNSFEAFKVRSVEEAGTPVCRAFISAKGPKSFESLIEPDSPVQFHAWFNAIPFSDATLPATSQYKVFYHIFAGNDQGVQYNVYLKDPPQTSYYQSSQTVFVAQGFIARGQFKTETRDFTAPAGYQQLCVRINNREECGFKQVSSSFAVDFVRDGFVNQEIQRTDITTGSECVSGSVGPSALLNPNIQEAAQEAIDPAIYNRGVTRICATDNPGKSTDPTRFVKAGYCDDQRVTCWLDKESVDNALSVENVGLKNETLSELNERSLRDLNNSGEFVIDGADDEINALTERVDNLPNNNIVSEASRVSLSIDSLYDKVVLNYHKARLLLLKGRTWDKVTTALHTEDSANSGNSNNVVPAASTTPSTPTTPAPQTNPTSSETEVFSLSSSYDPAQRIYLKFNNVATPLFVENNKLIYVDDSGAQYTVGTISSFFGFGKQIKLLPSAQSTLDNLDEDYYKLLDKAKIDDSKIVSAS